MRSHPRWLPVIITAPAILASVIGLALEPEPASEPARTAQRVAVPSIDPQAPSAVDDSSRESARIANLAGSYQIVRGERDGQPIPEDRIGNTVATFTKDTITVVDRDDKKLYAATFSLTPTADADVWNVQLVSQIPQEGIKSDGLLRVRLVERGIGEGRMETVTDEIHLIYALPDGETPTTFRAQKNQHLFVLKAKAHAAPSSNGS